MNQIIEKLSEYLIIKLKNADEIWIAVALMNYKGLNIILNSIKSTCHQNYLIGIDLPSEPKVFEKIINLKKRLFIKARYFKSKVTFHPKLYIIKSNNQLSAIIGSSNCTKGGFEKNVEINVKIDDKEICEDLLKWFQINSIKGKSINKKFLNNYTLNFDNRLKNRKEEIKILKNLYSQLENDEKNNYHNILKKRNQFRENLINYKSNIEEYTHDVEERKLAIEKLRKSLSYPSFEHPDIDKFFSIPDLGRLDYRAKSKIKENINNFKVLLKYLNKEEIPLIDRYNNALIKYNVKYINEGTISKILTIYDPDKYFVFNSKFQEALNFYGLLIEEDLNKGEKYQSILNILKEIKDDVGIIDFSVLDCFIYKQADLIKKRR